MSLPCPSNGFSDSSPLLASQIRVVWSLEPVAMCLFPSSENAINITPSVCPTSSVEFPILVSSGEKSAEVTHWLCASYGPEISSPSIAFHTQIVFLFEPDTMYCPLGEIGIDPIITNYISDDPVIDRSSVKSHALALSVWALVTRRVLFRKNKILVK